MKKYTFQFTHAGDLLTTESFEGKSKKEASYFATQYKRRELKKEYPSIPTNKIKVS